MFNDRYGLTQAVLEGRKTMTRRIIKYDYEKITAFSTTYGWYYDGETKDGETIEIQPQYWEGEKVAVAQPYKDIYPNADFKMVGDEFMTETAGWNNKMFVKANLMLHCIRITDIKMERLQDISEEDCMKEGVYKWIDCYIVSGIMENQGKNNVCFDTPREAFAALIDRINGKGTWERNPWVFAYEFELIK